MLYHDMLRMNIADRPASFMFLPMLPDGHFTRCLHAKPLASFMTPKPAPSSLRTGDRSFINASIYLHSLKKTFAIDTAILSRKCQDARGIYLAFLISFSGRNSSPG